MSTKGFQNRSGGEIPRDGLVLQEFSQLLCEGLRVGDRDGEGKPGCQNVAGDEDRSRGSDEKRSGQNLVAFSSIVEGPA